MIILYHASDGDPYLAVAIFPNERGRRRQCEIKLIPAKGDLDKGVSPFMAARGDDVGEGKAPLVMESWKPCVFFLCFIALRFHIHHDRGIIQLLDRLLHKAIGISGLNV